MSMGIMFGACKYIIDGMLCQRLGLIIVKSILLSEAMFFVIVSILAGINNGFGSLIAESARENETECKMLIRNGFRVIILLSIGVTVLCTLCKKPMIRLLVDWSELYAGTNYYFERWIVTIPFVMLFSYIMVLIRSLGDFKTPCLFIVGAVLVELGMTRIMVCSNVLSMATAKVCWNVVLFLIAYGYFRVKYPNLCRGKVNTKLNWSAWKKIFKSGIVNGVLGLPLALMILWESKMFAESSAYCYLYLLLGVLIMAPLMARLLVGKYSEN